MKIYDIAEAPSGDPLPKSLYAQGLTPWPATPLTCETQADIAVVGGGILGLSTALALAEAGVDVALLEAAEPGWGASGRNGGQVNSGLKHHPELVVRDFGEETLRFAYGAPATLGALVARLGLDCDYAHGGGYRAARTEAAARAEEALAEAMVTRGIPAEYHDAPRMAAATGTDIYTGALFDPEARQVNPLLYTRALAAEAVAAGTRLFTHSPVTSARRSPTGWELTTPKGVLRAHKVLFATNGYSGAVLPKLRRSLLPVYSAIAATEPLPAKLQRAILANRQVLYEVALQTIYYRIDAEGRLLYGGRGKMQPADGPGSVDLLIARATEAWPALKKVRWTHGWNGRLGITKDHYPHIHDMDGAGLICVGMNGRGVALTTALGPELARRLIEGDKAELPLPPTPIRPIPFQPFWQVGAKVVLGANTIFGKR